MSYLEDTIDWQAIQRVNDWLDSAVPEHYRGTLAQDWARISKIGEEIGEATEAIAAINVPFGRAISAFIGATGQNPRKGVTNGMEEVSEELADTALTAIFAMYHFAGNAGEVRRILREKQKKIYQRMLEAQKQ
jgi:hypothetical protein